MLAWRSRAVAAVAAFAGLPIGKREAVGGRCVWEKQHSPAAQEEMQPNEEC